VMAGSPHELSSNRDGRDATSRYDSFGSREGEDAADTVDMESLAEEQTVTVRISREAVRSDPWGYPNRTAAADANLGTQLEETGDGLGIPQRVATHANLNVPMPALSIVHCPPLADIIRRGPPPRDRLCWGT
jgi:hypothetical protein